MAAAPKQRLREQFHMSSIQHVSENEETPGIVARIRRSWVSLTRDQRVVSPIIDTGAWAVAIVSTTYLRFGLNSNLTLTSGLIVGICIAVSTQLLVGWRPLYRVRWKVGSFEQVVALSWTVGLSCAVLVLASFLFLRREIPIGAALASGAFTFVLTAGARCGWRFYREYQFQGSGSAERAIVFGAGEGGRQVIDALAQDATAPLVAVALLDDEPTKRQLQVRHLRVLGGRKNIQETARQFRAKTMIIAIPSAESPLIRELSDLATSADLTVRVLPPVAELFTVEVGVTDIRPITEADLLGRRALDTDFESMAEFITGRRVLVTGAGGSIGSELCRQLHQYAPSALIMLDRDESGLHQVQLNLEGRAMLDSRHLVVCDIRDMEALRFVFDEHRPDVVFHAAALKHLSLLEMWPAEAVKTNVIGTLNVLTVAKETGVSQLVNISSDKAADPTSVLGYTKRLAERLTSTVGQAADGEFISVRFGNVLGSRGSMLTVFRAQVEAGGPVTVTDPDVTRYFMTVQEAVQLTIQAGALGHSGRVLIIDMGEPVRITDVANRLIGQSSRPIQIVYTGLRPGEKRHEVTIGSDDNDQQLVHPLITSAEVPTMEIDALERIESQIDKTELVNALVQVCHSTALR
jgi:FlaA1/EpsC-like NDP-sugar epimerase